MEKNIFDAMIQWCLVFPEPLSQVAIEEATACTLHGLIVRQRLDAYLGGEVGDQATRQRALSRFNEDSALIIDGISCTLGELQSGQVEARLILEFIPENQAGHSRKVLRDATWRDIVHLPLIPWLTTIQQQIREKKREDGKSICLDGLVKKSGYIGERSLKYKAALAAARGVPLDEISSVLVRQTVVRELVDKKEYIRHGSTATLAMYNGRGEIVGSRTLTVD
jgi:hypothetical protein